jgi:hypothetical protein
MRCVHVTTAAAEVYNLRYTHKCDVFSMGMIIWEMCTRQYINVRPGKRFSQPALGSGVAHSGS